MTALAVEPRRPDAPGIRPGFLALLWLLATGALLALVASQPQRAWLPPAQTTAVLDGEHYRLDAAQFEWLQAFTRLHFSEGGQGARALLAEQLDAGLEAIFADVRARLPAFADWYYSLGGEYSRLTMAALARLNLADGEFIAARATEMLFPAEDWGRALAALDQRMVSVLQVEHQRLRQDWRTALGDRLAPYRVPAPLEPARGAAPGEALRLNDFVTRLVAGEQQVFRNRVQLSTVAGGGVAAGTVLWRSAAARAAAASQRAVAARGTGRAATRAGAASGLTICAPSGPAAVGCALLAGAAAWLATDWALLRIDEALHREDLLAALEAALGQLQAALQEDALAAFDAAARAHDRSVDGEITRQFTPALAGRSTGAD